LRRPSTEGQPRQLGQLQYKFGEVAEWLKALAWKASVRLYRTGGSNPPLSAIQSVQVTVLIALSRPDLQRVPHKVPQNLFGRQRIFRREMREMG
jgi:hypothetical protein